DQGEQALRLLHLPGPAPRLRQHERLLVLAPGRVLREAPAGRRSLERGHHRAPGRAGEEDHVTAASRTIAAGRTLPGRAPRFFRSCPADSGESVGAVRNGVVTSTSTR